MKEIYFIIIIIIIIILKQSFRQIIIGIQLGKPFERRLSKTCTQNLVLHEVLFG
jgi:hypothetical protein